jgi:hypothetical protein
VNNNLASVLTGGLLGNKKNLAQRAGALLASRRETKDAGRAAQGEAPVQAAWAEKGLLALGNGDLLKKKQRMLKKKKHGGLRKVFHKDVLYLLIVNLPSEEEMEQSVAELERVMQQR